MSTRRAPAYTTAELAEGVVLRATALRDGQRVTVFTEPASVEGLADARRRAAEAGAWLDLVTPWGVVDLLNRVFGPADVVMFQLATLEAARRRAKRAGV